MAKATTKASLTASTALAEIKAKRDSMNVEQAGLEVPILEQAIADITEKGAKLLEALAEARDAIIHPMAKDQINNVFIVVEKVPVALKVVIDEHKRALEPVEAPSPQV